MLGHGRHGMFRRHGDLFDAGLRIVDGRDWLLSDKRKQRCARARKQLDRIGPWCYPLLRSSNRWPQLVPLVKALLAGKTARLAARETGHAPGTANRILRLIELATGKKCGCGRAVRHFGMCRNRRALYPDKWRKRICKGGHILSAENARFTRTGRECMICANQRRRDVRTRERIQVARGVSRMLGDNKAAGIVLRFYRPKAIARAAMLLRAGVSASQINRISSISSNTLGKLAAALTLAGWRCPCGRALTHLSRCLVRRRLECTQGVA